MIPHATVPPNYLNGLEDNVGNDGMHEKRGHVTKEEIWRHPLTAYFVVVMTIISLFVMDFQLSVLLTLIFIIIPAICIETYAVIFTLIRRSKDEIGYITKEDAPQHLLLIYTMAMLLIISALFYSDGRLFVALTLVFIVLPFVAFAVAFKLIHRSKNKRKKVKK